MIKLTICVLLLIVAGGSPWLLGGISPWCDALAPMITLLAALLWIFVRPDRNVSWSSWGAIAAASLLTGFVWLQATPLPDAVIHRLTSQARLDRINQLLTTKTSCHKESTVAEQTSASPNWNRITSDPPETHRRWAVLATALAVGLLSMSIASDERCRLVLVFAMAINGAAFGVLALFMRASSPGLIYWSIKPQWQSMPFGAFVNRNHAGLFLALSGLFALFGICLLLSQRITPLFSPADRESLDSRRRSLSLTDLRMIWLSQKDSVLFFLAFCALFCAVSSIVAASRSGFLAFGAVILVAALMLFLAGADRRLILAIGVLGGIAAIVSGTKFEFLMDRFDAEAVESGWLGRYAHWSDVLDQFGEFAVTGTGYGTYAYSTLPYISNVNTVWFKNADNQFVESFVELGALGVFLIVVFMMFFGIRCAMLLRSQNLQAKIVSLFGAGILAISIINAMGDFALAVAGVLLPMSLAAGFVLGFRSDEKDQAFNSVKLGLGWAVKLTAFGIVMVAGLIGATQLATSQKPIDRSQDPIQWFCRYVSQMTDNPSINAIIADADESISEFKNGPLRSIRAIDSELLQDDSLPLENLAMFRRALGSEDVDPDFFELRNSLNDLRSLNDARSRYQNAVRLAPMRFDSYLMLAKLDLFLCPGVAVTEEVTKARLINPLSGVDAARAGIVSIINGDVERGGEMLGQALLQESRLERDIYAVLKAELSVQQVAKYVLKQHPNLIIRAADHYYNARGEWAARNFLYSQLRLTLEKGHLDNLTEPQAKYYLAKSKLMAGEIESGFIDFEAACSDWNSPLEWHNELATQYEQQGRLREAKNTLMRMQSSFGYDAGRERKIANLEKLIRSAPVIPKS